MNKSQKKVAEIAVGVGAAALAATAAGMYFFGGKAGAKNRKKVAKWADDAKKQVMKEMGNMQKVTKENYNKVVDGIAKQYKGLKNIDQSEVLALTKELKGHWDQISKEVSAAGKKVKSATKKVAATAKKAVTKKPAAKKPAAKKK